MSEPAHCTDAPTLKVFAADEPAQRSRRLSGDHTNGVIVSRYLDHLRVRLGADDLSQVHMTACERDLHSFLAHRPADADLPMSELRISESTNADMEAWLLSTPQSNATRRRKRSEVVTCFQWAAREGGVIPPNASPYYRSRAMRLPVQPRREAEQSEYLALLAADPRIVLPLEFLARTGARPCEMRESCWPDVDWQERVIELFANKTFRKTGRSRVIGLEPEIFDRLRRHFEAAADKSGSVFLNSRNQPWSADSWAKAVKRAVLGAGIDKGRGHRLTSGMFRHRWAANAAEAGCTDREIADGLGHSGTQLVSWYSKARKRKANQRRIAEKAANVRRTENP